MADAGRCYGMITDEPVVLRPSKSVWALATSARAYSWLMWILTVPEVTASNRALAPSARISGLRVWVARVGRVT